MKEQHQITITRYYDKDNNPTCAADFSIGDVCIFYATQKFGCSETCWFADQSGKKWGMLKRRKKGEGTLIPNDECPIWKNKIT